MKLFITEKPTPAMAIAAVIGCDENFSPDESVLHQVNEVGNTRGDYRENALNLQKKRFCLMKPPFGKNISDAKFD